MNKNRIVIAVVCILAIPQYALSEDAILEPETWSFPKIIESARKISPNNTEGKPFNQFGLVYSPEQLSVLKLSKLAAQDLQKYADIVTHAYPDAVAKQLPVHCKDIPINKLNETTVAGIAYVSINAVNSATRKWADKCLTVIQNNFAKAGR